MSAQSIFQNADISKQSKGVIVDYREVLLDFGVTEVNRIREFIRKNSGLPENFKIAVVTSDPYIVAMTILVSRSDHGLPIQPFSTMDGAKIWIRKQD
ncbi:MAG: hypothetical protein R6U46_11805 [Marinilabilia sp.]